MRILDIIAGTTVDGPGLRTSVYMAGCAHHCPGCHNPQSWDPAGGREVTLDEILAEIKDNDFNVTLSGGDPLLQAEETIELARRIKQELGKTVWLYTGYTIEQIRSNTRLAPVLEWVDAVVDGPFIESLRDISLQFRGSSNQRIIEITHP